MFMHIVVNFFHFSFCVIQATAKYWTMAAWLYSCHKEVSSYPIEKPFMSYDDLLDHLTYDPCNPRSEAIAHLFESKYIVMGATMNRLPRPDSKDPLIPEGFHTIVMWHYLHHTYPQYEQSLQVNFGCTHVCSRRFSFLLLFIISMLYTTMQNSLFSFPVFVMMLYIIVTSHLVS